MEKINLNCRKVTFLQKNLQNAFFKCQSAEWRLDVSHTDYSRSVNVDRQWMKEARKWTGTGKTDPGNRSFLPNSGFIHYSFMKSSILTRTMYSAYTLLKIRFRSVGGILAVYSKYLSWKSGSQNKSGLTFPSNTSFETTTRTHTEVT